MKTNGNEMPIHIKSRATIVEKGTLKQRKQTVRKIIGLQDIQTEDIV